MDNELRKTLDVKLNINIDGTAAFGIVLASIAGLCFSFYTGTKSRFHVLHALSRLAERKRTFCVTAYIPMVKLRLFAVAFTICISPTSQISSHINGLLAPIFHSL